MSGNKYAPAPRKRGAMPGGAKARATYDLCHRAWRAGVISSWYYGKRSPSDPTIVWEINGAEIDGPEYVADKLDRTLAAAGIDSIKWGEEWIGYRSVIVTYRNGAVVTERLHESTQSVVVGDVPPRMAGHREGTMVWSPAVKARDFHWATSRGPWKLVPVERSERAA